jgi:transposase InsO family protein
VEEVNGRRYLDFDHAKTCIGTFIEEVYNQQRMHSALNYDSPVEFENRRPVETAAAEEIVKGRFAASTL